MAICHFKNILNFLLIVNFFLHDASCCWPTRKSIIKLEDKKQKNYFVLLSKKEEYREKIIKINYQLK